MTDKSEPDRLSRAEINKDAIQSTAEAAATTVGEVATILTSAVKDVATAVGGFATELFEIREASRRASEEHDPRGPRDLEGRTGPEDVEDLQDGE